MDKNTKRNKRTRRRAAVVVISLLLLLTAIVGATLAYIIDTTEEIENTFIPSVVEVEVEEDFDGTVKNNVKIKNTGDTDAYVRARVIAYWQKIGTAEIYGVAPVAGVDYEITWCEDDNAIEGKWVRQGQYHYFTKAIEPGTCTDFLFTDCKPLEGKTPEGYKLVVEVLTQAIQAEGDAVEEAWKVSITETGVTVSTKGREENT